MDVKVTRHFNYQTPLDEAQNEQELAKIFRLKWPKAKNLMLSDCRFFADMIEQARKYKAWKVIGFNSLEEFIKAELDTSLAEVESIIAGVKIAREGGESGPISKADAISRARENADSVQGKRTDKLNGNSIKCEQGTTNGNILRRLAREGTRQNTADREARECHQDKQVCHQNRKQRIDAKRSAIRLCVRDATGHQFKN